MRRNIVRAEEQITKFLGNISSENYAGCQKKVVCDQCEMPDPYYMTLRTTLPKNWTQSYQLTYMLWNKKKISI